MDNPKNKLTLPLVIVCQHLTTEGIIFNYTENGKGEVGIKIDRNSMVNYYSGEGEEISYTLVLVDLNALVNQSIYRFHWTMKDDDSLYLSYFDFQSKTP